MIRRDPLANPDELIRRVYAYVAYRLGDGPEAQDVTSATFERALKGKDSYDPARGTPIGWLFGIARRCLSEAVESRLVTTAEPPDRPAPGDLAERAVARITLAEAIATLDDREQELIALRYGGDLTAKKIGEVLGLETNAVEVALHRALRRLRERLEIADATRRPTRGSGSELFAAEP